MSRATFVVVLDWLACIGLPVIAALGLSRLYAEVPLPAPGWDCPSVLSCLPKPGWHFERDAYDGSLVAIRDVFANQWDRQTDLDTARNWPKLTNEARQKILDQDSSIYDFGVVRPAPR
jgi:hypothetical protein